MDASCTHLADVGAPYISKEGSDRFCFSYPRLSYCGARHIYTIPHSGLARCLASTICVRNSVSLHQPATMTHNLITPR
jgi:hypothetical protein